MVYHLPAGGAVSPEGRLWAWGCWGAAAASRSWRARCSHRPAQAREPHLGGGDREFNFSSFFATEKAMSWLFFLSLEHLLRISP